MRLETWKKQIWLHANLWLVWFVDAVNNVNINFCTLTTYAWQSQPFDYTYAECNVSLYTRYLLFALLQIIKKRQEI